eukprot:symbB.v1.2.018955.t1/scaffold1484.1/size180055/7
MRGQLLSFSWPNDFGADFLAEFSQAPNQGGFRAKDNAMRLFEMVLTLPQEFCTVNGRQYDRNQCTSMANTLVVYARLYYESFQTFTVQPFGLTFQEGAGLFVKASLGDLLGYYAGYDDPISSYMLPRRVSWNAVRSQTQVEVTAEMRAGFADAQNGQLNAGPLGRSVMVSNSLENLGSLTKYQGRRYVTEFDFQGCRPMGDGGRVVVPPDGPYPPQCYAGSPLQVGGSKGDHVTPQVWSLQEGVQDKVKFFSKTLMRPLSYSWVEDFELPAENNDVVSVRRFELKESGLSDARLAFNCEEIFKSMSESGVLNRGSDCDTLPGMFDLSMASNRIPYVWSLPHFYLVEAQDSTQHPRNNLIGFVTPTGPRYRNMVVIERHSGRVLQKMFKEQISIRLYKDERNYFFTKHKSVAIPLYWRMDTKNATIAERQLLSVMQSTFRGLEAGFIACMILGGVSLFAALFVGMLLYRDNSLQTVQEKRKRIQAELAAAIPPDAHEDRDDEADENADLIASSTCILFSHCFVCQHCSIAGLHEKAPLSRNPSAKLAPGKSRQGEVECAAPYNGTATTASCPAENVDAGRNATVSLPSCTLQCDVPTVIPEGYEQTPEGWRCLDGFIGGTTAKTKQSSSVSSSASASRFSTKESVIVTDLIAQSFIKIFNNAFLNTIERVRQPHLINVLKNLKTFAARVPPKYRGSIEKALRTEGFLSFLLSRAAVSLLCAKATLRPSETQLGREHEELATVVEELYIAALLHAEDQWDLELKADGKTFMAVAASFVKHLADPAPLKTANIQAALLGLDANPLIWTRYGLDLLGISLNSISIGGSDMGTSTEPKDRRKVSLLGGDSLYATAQWAMAKLDSRACRKLIAATIASYSDGQLRKRELLWNLDLTVKQYLEIEKVAGVAAFFGASTACAAFVNRVSDGIAAQLADFGSDLGLVVSLLKDVRTVGMQTALKLGRISAPIIFAMQRDQRLRELLSTRLTNPQDFEEALRRVKEYGMMPTIHLVNKLGARAAARLECLEESEEKEALLTLVRGVACLHLMEDGNVASDDAMVEAELNADPESRVFDMKVANLRLRAQLQRVHSSEQRSKNRLDSIEAIARGDDVDTSSKRRTPKGLGLEFDSEEVEWLILRGLERRTPLPPQLDLNHLLSCVTNGRDEVQNRLIGLREVAQSTKLKNAIMEVFSSGGKRLRPALCLLVHSMLKTEGSADSAAAYEKVIVLATSIEIIHTASLVHDDILDDADQRRQQQTMHRIFGPDVAVLSGDFLFAHASGLIESLEDDEVTRLVSLVIEEFGYGDLAVK